MKNILTLIMLFSFFYVSGQDTKLAGDIDINLSKNTINGTFIISNYASSDTSILFTLNNNYWVTSIKLNDKKIDFDSLDNNCYNCNVFEIPLEKGLRLSDNIHITVRGEYLSFEAGTYQKDYKGLMVKTSSIFRASEQSKWYPTLMQKKHPLPFHSRKHPYRYDFTVTCDCDNIYLAQGVPQKSGSRFYSDTPSEYLMLIAGNFEWEEGQYATYINVPNPKDRQGLEEIFSKIKTYYESHTNIKMPAKFILANIPSGKQGWGGFTTYPTIVSTRANVKNNIMTEHIMAHEVAHYLFGDIYKPHSNLFWFYLESFAEYYSLKYWIANNPKIFILHYFRLPFVKENFVRLDQVKKIGEINGSHRYSIGSFQLLLLEEKIGEQKMLELIQTVFPKLGQTEDGYQALITSLKSIGIEQSVIQDIEENIFKTLDLDEYKILKKKVPYFNVYLIGAALVCLFILFLLFLMLRFIFRKIRSFFR